MKTRTSTFPRVTRLAAALSVVAALWACGPVYIPVPPPNQIAFTAETLTDSAGSARRVWIASGGTNAAAAAATFYIFDADRNAGVIAVARRDGTFQSPLLEGDEGDHVQIYFTDPSGKRSSVACLLLTEQRPSAAGCP